MLRVRFPGNQILVQTLTYEKYIGEYFLNKHLERHKETELNRRSQSIEASTEKFSANSRWSSGAWMDLQSNAELRQSG